MVGQTLVMAAGSFVIATGFFAFFFLAVFARATAIPPGFLVKAFSTKANTFNFARRTVKAGGSACRERCSAFIALKRFIAFIVFSRYYAIICQER